MARDTRLFKTASCSIHHEYTPTKTIAANEKGIIKGP